MTAREEAEELRQKAIETLLDEKRAIEEQLKLLGYGRGNLDTKTPWETSQERRAASQVGTVTLPSTMNPSRTRISKSSLSC